MAIGTLVFLALSAFNTVFAIMADMSRFRLIPGLRRLLLPTGVQLGSDPDRALLLRLPNLRFAELLDRLDGWLDEAGFELVARRLGLPGHEADALLKQLRGAGLLLDATAVAAGNGGRPVVTAETSALAQRRSTRLGTRLAARRRHRVLVNGTGRLANQIAALLRESELGRVWCADDGYRATPTLSVLINLPQPPALIARAHARRRLPHLLVRVADGGAAIGPLVRPGVTGCVHCVELHYRDSLPHWRGVIAQPGDADLLEATTRSLVASTIAGVVMQHIDGDPCDADGAVVQLGPAMRTRRRPRPPHPNCGCITGV